LADRRLALGDARLELAIAGDAAFADAGQLRNAERGVADGADRAGLHAAIVERPFADADLAEADLAEIAGRGRERPGPRLGAVGLGALLLRVLDVESQHEIGAAQ